jgi:hypothetical protein
MIPGLLLALSSAVVGGVARPQRASLAALIAVEGAIFATGAALVRISTRRLVLRRAEGLLLGGAAGALFGVSDGVRASSISGSCSPEGTDGAGGRSRSSALPPGSTDPRGRRGAWVDLTRRSLPHPSPRAHKPARAMVLNPGGRPGDRRVCGVAASRQRSDVVRRAYRSHAMTIPTR